VSGDEVTGLAGHNNGLIGEAIAEDRLKRLYPFDEIQHVNGIIDFIVNDRYIEVKSCQRSWRHGERDCLRAGMFRFRADQHNMLCDLKGLYMLIVLDGNVCHRIGIVMPEAFDFKRQMAWTNFFAGGL